MSGATIEPMTDPDVAQAAVLIAALVEQLRDMAPKLILAERHADSLAHA